MIDYEKIARRIEIATRNLPLFNTHEIDNKGMEDRKRITEIYRTIKEQDNDNIVSLNDARYLILLDILKEELREDGDRQPIRNDGSKNSEIGRSNRVNGEENNTANG